MGTDKEQKEIDRVISTFPDEFSLKAFPGSRFRISRHNSYFRGPGECGGELMLYTQKYVFDVGWIDFAKGTEAELRKQVVA